jgi:alpha-methylacyl-CoA racemase
VAHGTFSSVDGVVQPAPAPRFSRTPPATPSLPAPVGQHTAEILLDWGFSAEEASTLLTDGAVVQARNDGQAE